MRRSLEPPTFRCHQTVKQLFTDEITARWQHGKTRRLRNRPCNGEFIGNEPLSQFLQALKRMCRAEGGRRQRRVVNLITKKPGSRSSGFRRGRTDIRLKEKSQRAAAEPLVMAVDLATHRNNSPFCTGTKQYSGPAMPIFNNFGFYGDFCLFVLKVPLSLPGC